MVGDTTTETSADDTTVTSSIAFRLLEMQQRLEAWDRLYNQEVTTLQRELAQLKANYVRQQQAQAQAEKPRPRRTSRKARNTTPSDA
jgi:hypothetical protein